MGVGIGVGVWRWMGECGRLRMNVLYREIGVGGSVFYRIVVVLVTVSACCALLVHSLPRSTFYFLAFVSPPLSLPSRLDFIYSCRSAGVGRQDAELLRQRRCRRRGSGPEEAQRVDEEASGE